MAVFCLRLGLLSPLGSLAKVGAMLVAIATVHISKGFWATKGGYEFNLSLIEGAAVFDAQNRHCRLLIAP